MLLQQVYLQSPKLVAAPVLSTPSLLQHVQGEPSPSGNFQLFTLRQMHWRTRLQQYGEELLQSMLCQSSSCTALCSLRL